MSDQPDRRAPDGEDEPDGPAAHRVPDPAVLDELSRAFEPTVDAPRPEMHAPTDDEDESVAFVARDEAEDAADGSGEAVIGGDVEPTHVELDDAEPTDAERDDVEPTDAEPDDLEPTDLEPTDVEPTDLGSDDVEPTDVESDGAEPTDAEPGDAEPTDAEPTDLGSDDAELVDAEDETGGGAARTTGSTPLARVLPIGEPSNLIATVGEESPSPEADEDASGPRTIKIGGDDELPDTVYLDDELARDDSDEQTVFIDDDGTSDAIAPKDATGPGMEPRLRQRRIGVRRSEGLRRLRWVILVGAIVLVVVGALAFLASPVFDIDDVSVVGEQYTDPDELQAVVDDLIGTPVLLADTSEAEDRLEAIPWVETARVRTDFPNAASIEIRERTAVAAMPGADGASRVLDREGRILDVIDGQPIALVWIAGPITLDQPAGEFAPVGPSSAASLATKLTPTVRRRLDSILVTPDGADLRLMLRPLTDADADGDGTPDGAEGESGEDAGEDAAGASTTLPPVAPGSGGPLIEVRFGSAIGDNQQIEKLVRLERVLDDVGTEPVTSIDVSTAEVTIL